MHAWPMVKLKILNNRTKFFGRRMGSKSPSLSSKKKVNGWGSKQLIELSREVPGWVCCQGLAKIPVNHETFAVSQSCCGKPNWFSGLWHCFEKHDEMTYWLRIASLSRSWRCVCEPWVIWENGYSKLANVTVSAMMQLTKPSFYEQKRSIFPEVQDQWWGKLWRRPLINMVVRIGFRHHVCLRTIELSRVVRKIPPFRIRIGWGAVPMNFPAFWVSVSRRSLKYGTSPHLWVKEKLVKFRQGTQDTWLRFVKLFRQFLSYPPFNLLGDLGDVILG